MRNKFRTKDPDLSFSECSDKRPFRLAKLRTREMLPYGAWPSF